MSQPVHAPLPVLYSFRRCPYAMRARLAILASAQACALREVLLRDKPPQLIEASPKATVPVLVLPDGRVLEQSLAIMRWALSRNDPLEWLGADASRTQALVAECDGSFKQALDAYKYPQRQAASSSLLPDARGSCSDFMRRLEALLQTHRSLCGDHDSMADAAVFPFVRQFAGVDSSWFDAQPWPCLQAWLRRWTQSNLFDRAMVRHPPWRVGEPIVVFGALA